MPPACVHFKNRIMPSAIGTCNEEMPPAKRSRETLSTSSVTHSDPRAKILGKTPENEKRLAQTGNSVPDEKSCSRGPDAKPSSRGILPKYYTVTDPKALECPICFNPLSLPIYQVRFAFYGIVS